MSYEWSNTTNDGKTPEGRKGGYRRLIVCSDGTWLGSDKANEVEIRRSNVARLSQLILPSYTSKGGIESPQIMYYQAGESVVYTS
jgi:hypothetical protein